MSISAPHRAKARKHFTAFRSAAEEATAKLERESWDNEGGAASAPANGGCVIYTPGEDLPYKVLLIHRGRPDSEHPFATMRDAEAFIRHTTPRPAPLSKLYDRDAD
jgi:hypothetical protein